MATVEERVKAVTARILKVDPKQIKPEHNFTVDLGASSVQSVELVASFEEEFGIEMEEDAALSVQSIGGAVEFITGVCKEQGVDIEE
ncbi:MAG: acyl carrier protein [Phycisphaerae bacterium]|nr:acyl carrier protein [Phycisphaerae bacterium]